MKYKILFILFLKLKLIYYVINYLIYFLDLSLLNYLYCYFIIYIKLKNYDIKKLLYFYLKSF